MCYTPASYAKPEDLALKAQLFKDRKGTVSRLPTYLPTTYLFIHSSPVQSQTQSANQLHSTSQTNHP